MNYRHQGGRDVTRKARERLERGQREARERPERGKRGLPQGLWLSFLHLRGMYVVLPPANARGPPLLPTEQGIVSATAWLRQDSGRTEGCGDVGFGGDVGDSGDDDTVSKACWDAKP
jgi:hypothetical protein